MGTHIPPVYLVNDLSNHPTHNVSPESVFQAQSTIFYPPRRKETFMTTCEDRLFSYPDLPLITPWLTRETCEELRAAGLFTPRIVRHETEPEIPYMNVYDLIALTSVQQLLRSGITADQLRMVLHAPSSFRCDGFSDDNLLFLSTEAIRGQELSQFLQVTKTEATVLVRHFLDGGAEVEFIPTELLEARDFQGETLTGVECKVIRDRIRANVGSSITRGPEQVNFDNRRRVPKSST